MKAPAAPGTDGLSSVSHDENLFSLPVRHLAELDVILTQRRDIKASSWNSEEHSLTRKKIFELVIASIRQHPDFEPNLWLQKATTIARLLEESLYETAANFIEYCDISTLRSRLAFLFSKMIPSSTVTISSADAPELKSVSSLQIQNDSGPCDPDQGDTKPSTKKRGALNRHISCQGCSRVFIANGEIFCNIRCLFC